MPIFVADFDFSAESSTELTFRKGEILNVLSQDKEWWYGELLTASGGPTGNKGWFVPSYGHLAISISPYRDLSPTEMLKRRTAVAMQIFQSEKAFLGTLKSFIDLVVEPIRLLDTPFKRSLMADASIGLSLTLLQEIYEACKIFLNGIVCSTSAVGMADCYAQFSPSLQLFAQYSAENTKALSSLKGFSKPLNEFMSGIHLPDGITMEYCLILPLNHYTKYAPDFQEFIWLTPLNASELPALETALLALSEQSRLVDEKNREEEEAKQLVQLQYLFQGNPQIFKPGRKIICKGELEKVRKDKTGQHYSTKTYYAHLFNDVLMYSVKYSLSGTFKLHKVVDLNDAVVEKCRLPATDVLSTLTNLFSLTAKGDNADGAEKVDLFRVDDIEDFLLWMNSIQKQIVQLKANALKMEKSSALAVKSSLSPTTSAPPAAKLGSRGQCINHFLEKEMEYAEAMSAINSVVVQPLLDASKTDSITGPTNHQ